MNDTFANLEIYESLTSIGNDTCASEFQWIHFTIHPRDPSEDWRRRWESRSLIAELCKPVI